MREKIEIAVKDALARLGAGDARFVVERPRSMEHGDYATNAGLVAKVDPEHLRSQLRSLLSSDEVESIEVAGKFVNFRLSRQALVPKAQEIPQLYAGQEVMVEYTDPNPFKEFHIGHLMSNTIGESIARLFEASGAKVRRANYQGDVGLHVAKAIWGKRQKPDAPWGEAYVYGSNEYEAHKDEVDALNKVIYEKSETGVNALYDEGRAASLAHFEELYKKLGTKFDHYFFESETAEPGLALVRNNIGGVFAESEGAIIYPGEQDGLHTRVFINKTGLPTYEAKDLGLLARKARAGSYDLSVTVTASEQKDYFKVVLAAAKKIAEIADIANKTRHITHGMMRFAEGKMSSRKGNVITGESLLVDLIQEGREKMQGRELRSAEKTAEAVAVGAIKYAVLKQGSGRDIIFDPEKSLSLEGDSGPYLQYARVRALSLLEKAKEAGINPFERPDGGRSGPLGQDLPSASPLERVLLHYPEVVERAAREMEPHYITTYLTELAGAFNSWYASNKVVGGEHPHYGVLLVEAFEKTMSQGLHILGIPAPEEM